METFNFLICSCKESPLLIEKCLSLSQEIKVIFSKERMEWLLNEINQGFLDKEISLQNIIEIFMIILSFGEENCLQINVSLADNYCHLKNKWISSELDHIKGLSYSERSEIMANIMEINWSLELIHIFLFYVNENNLNIAKNIIMALKKYPIKEEKIIKMLELTGNLNKISESLPDDLNFQQDFLYVNLFPKEIQKNISSLFIFYFSNEITTLLKESLVRLFAIYLLTPSFTNQFVHSINFLIEYNMSFQICKKAFEIIDDSPLEFEQKIHHLVIENTFLVSKERTFEEIVDSISKNSPNIKNSIDLFKKKYQNIIQIYEKPSALLTKKLPNENKLSEKEICKWNASDIYLWTKAYKEESQFRIADLFEEMTAVIMQAVKLSHSYLPRITQILSFVILFLSKDKGMIIQINTGEGKSIIVAMLAAAFALQNQKVDVLTSSTELSKPEAIKQRPFFELFGLTVDDNSDRDGKKSQAAKQEVYKKDVVYGTPSDFQGDILRELQGENYFNGRGNNIAIVDEVDNMLFDNRNYSVQLSSHFQPGMHQLEFALAFVWNQVLLVNSQITEIDGKKFFVYEKFKKDGNQITLMADKKLEDCLEPVENIREFTKEKLSEFLKQSFRKLTFEEMKEWEQYENLNNEIKDIVQNSSTEDKNKKKLDLKEKELKQCSWIQKQRPYFVNIPDFLRDFSISQVPAWIDSALSALHVYQEKTHYVVQNNKIVPVDLENTGVLQNNMTLSNGLTQMLQIKEGLPLTPEGVSQNFLSTPSFFLRYGTKIFGLTGTVGNEHARAFFSDVYKCQIAIIPPYKQCLILGNEKSLYVSKELPGIVFDDFSNWYIFIIENTLIKLNNKRAVLIICECIKTVEVIATGLKKVHKNPNKVLTYTGEENFTKRTISSEEVIVATNISGRGTDLSTDEEVEKNGGLHVCITFLPESLRVELQNSGRTGRQGKRGTSQLVVYDTHNKNIQDLKKIRDDEEYKILKEAKEQVGNILIKDQLFTEFCDLENELIKIKNKFIIEENKKKILEKIKDQLRYLNSLLEILEQKKKDLESNSKKDSKELDEKQEKMQKDLENSKLEEQNLKQTLTDIKNEMKQKNSYSDQYKWNSYDRKGLEERFGFWLHKQPANIDFKLTNESFHHLLNEIMNDAPKNNLIKNSYIWVLKGNYGLKFRKQKNGNIFYTDKSRSKALNCYNKAIEIEPKYSANARFNKAKVLLGTKNSENYLHDALKELTEAKKLLETFDKEKLLMINCLITNSQGKPGTTAHIQQQLNILSLQEQFIENAISDINEAITKDWSVYLNIEGLDLETLFKDNHENHSEAINKSRENGLHQFFKVTPYRKTKWWEYALVALLGFSQIVAGCAITTFTGGTLGYGLISEGVNDIITVASSAIFGGNFSLKDWAMQKAVSISVSLVCAGWENIRKGWNTINNSMKQAKMTISCAMNQGFKNSLCKYGSESGAKIAFKQLGLALAKGAAGECLSKSCSYIIDKTLTPKIEELIFEKTTQIIDSNFRKDEMVSKIIEIDNLKKNNDWQNKIICEAEKLVTTQKSDLWNLCEQTVKSYLAQKQKGLSATLKILEAGITVNELINLANDISCSLINLIQNNFKETVDSELNSERDKDQKKKREEKEKEEISKEAIKTNKIAEDCTKELKVDYSLPSCLDKIVNSISKLITQRLLYETKTTIVNPVVSMGNEMILSSAFKNWSSEVERITKEYEVNCDRAFLQYELTNSKIVNISEEELKIKINQEKDTFFKQKIIEKLNSRIGDLNDIDNMSKNYGFCIEIYDENGKILYRTSNYHAKIEIKRLTFSQKKEGEIGHYHCASGDSSKQDCLFRALYEQMSEKEKKSFKILSSDDLIFQNINFMLENPNISAKQFFLAEIIKYSDPKPLLMGGQSKENKIDLNIENILKDFVDKPYSQDQNKRNGPDFFDCSGLVKQFLRRLFPNIKELDKLPSTTRDYESKEKEGVIEQMKISEGPPEKYLEPFDMLWKKGHVALYIGQGRVITAQNVNKPSKIYTVERYRKYFGWEKVYRVNGDLKKKMQSKKD